MIYASTVRLLCRAVQREKAEEQAQKLRGELKALRSKSVGQRLVLLLGCHVCWIS
jgi:hypothetical protein